MVATSVTLAILVVQVKSAVMLYGSRTLDLTIYGPVETAILHGAYRGLTMVGMILLPVFLFLVGYVSVLSERGRSQDHPREAGRNRFRVGHAGRRARKSSFILFAVWILVWVVLAQPRPARLEPSGELAGLQYLLALNPSSPSAYYALAVHHERQGRLEEAVQRYDEALRLDPDHVKAHFGRGNILFKRGDYDGAISSYHEVLKRDPTIAAASYNLGNALFELALYERAARAYEEAITVNASHASAHKNLGVALLELDRPCDALPHFERSTALDRRYLNDTDVRAKIRELMHLCTNLQPGKLSDR
jgi:tetratricopeptide (TPR) repeat protein